MKKFKMNKFLAFGLGVLIAIVLLIVGKETGHQEHATLATIGAAVVSLSDAEKTGFSEQEQKVILAVKKLTVQLQEQVKAGAISKDELAAAVSGIKTELTGGEIKNLQDELKKLDDVAKAQGTSLAAIQSKMNNSEVGVKSIAQQLKDDEEEIKTIYRNGVGAKTYMVGVNAKGEFVMRPYDVTGNKAAGPHAASADVGTSGNAASITQSIDAATLLRLGGQSPIMAQFRNSPWVFGLCNLINAGFENPFAMWYDEAAKVSASANVSEGGTKPTVQYKYELKTSTYKKEAMLVSFTDEFALDFTRLQDEILGKARVDLINRINDAVLPRIVTAATAYNTSASFGTVANVNDFDVLAAMAAQVENATFATSANSAVMSTFKKHKLGIQKNTQGSYLNPPASLSNLAFVGNPSMAADDVLVGDFTNYNIILRGGLIVKVGYNGTDFANNMFSTVLEQYYFDYISSARTTAIVKGPDFATVKSAITES